MIQKSDRYEKHDEKGKVREMRKLCQEALNQKLTDSECDIHGVKEV